MRADQDSPLRSKLQLNSPRSFMMYPLWELVKRILPFWKKYWHFWLVLLSFNPETSTEGGKTPIRGHGQHVLQLVRLGWKRVSLPKVAEGPDDFSSCIALKKVSRALGIRQPKHHHLSEVSWGKKMSADNGKWFNLVGTLLIWEEKKKGKAVVGYLFVNWEIGITKKNKQL